MAKGFQAASKALRSIFKYSIARLQDIPDCCLTLGVRIAEPSRDYSGTAGKWRETRGFRCIERHLAGRLV